MLQLLLNLAERAKLRTKMNAMFSGEHINSTEDRAVLHTALRAPRDDVSHESCSAMRGGGAGGGAPHRGRTACVRRLFLPPLLPSCI